MTNKRNSNEMQSNTENNNVHQSKKKKVSLYPDQTPYVRVLLY